jgi:ABC-type branched-subunit amino acid transport system substrate-binding protein
MLASNGYEAVLVLEDALEQTAGQASGLPEALATINNLKGTQGVFSIDAYGDAEREIYIIQVKDGQFKLVNIISPASRE